MYRLLLVDDEQISIDTIESVIARDLNGIFIMDLARTGRDSIKKAHEFRPDVVLADVRLLGQSGMEAIYEIKSSYPNTIFIISSAYERLDYAREAMSLGVIENLLKPITRQRLTQTLLHVAEQIDRDRKKRMKELEIKEKLDSVNPALEHGFINSVIFYDASTSQLRYNLKLLGFENETGLMLTIIVGSSDAVTPGGQVAWNVRCQYHYPVICDLTKSMCKCVVGPAILNQIAVFVQFPEDEDQMQSAYDLSLILRERIETLTQTPCRIGIGNAITDLSVLHRSYEESIWALRMMDTAVARAQDVPLHDEDQNYPDQLEGQVISRLAAGHGQQACAAFQQLFAWINTNHPGDLRYLKARVTEILVIAYRMAKDCGAKEGGLQYLYTLQEKNDSPSVQRYVLSQIEAMASVIGIVRDRQLSPAVRKARDVVDRSYSQDLTLQTIASIAGISMHYLSRVFKDEMGISIMVYLGLTRIQKAREMLEEGKMSVKEIGFAVGYGDPNYFSRIFKKYVGTTPTEYRDKAAEGDARF